MAEETVDNLVARLFDLKLMATYNGGGLINTRSGTWDKFAFGGKRPENPSEPPVKLPESDVNIESLDAIAKLFDSTVPGTKYMNTIESVNTSANVPMAAKLASDMLASMHQAVAQRYNASRIRSMASAASRLRGIGESDAELLKLYTQLDYTNKLFEEINEEDAE